MEDKRGRELGLDEMGRQATMRGKSKTGKEKRKGNRKRQKRTHRHR